MPIDALNHITLSVSNLERSFAFYHDVMGFKPLVKWDKGAYFLVGDLWFCLVENLNTKLAAGYTHYAFSVSKEQFSGLVSNLESQGCEPFQKNASPGDSFYFKDPDGHQLEIHAGTYTDRLKAKKENPGTWKDVTWFV